jgi:hypothetical protein
MKNKAFLHILKQLGTASGPSDMILKESLYKSWKGRINIVLGKALLHSSLLSTNLEIKV